MTDVDTIFALSSGSPPAGIAIIRISGSSAGAVLVELTGRPLPAPRIASLALLSNPGESVPLDRALTLWFPGPASATGEDVAELHLHGGRAVVAAVSRTLAGFVGLREAEPGEFTRRAFEHGRIDFAEAEALGDLLSAETEMQRRSAIAHVGGALHRLTGEWANRIVSLSARVEAMIDFSDEDDVEPLPFTAIWREASMVALDIRKALSRPPAERLRDGLRVAIVGPPNSGKSTLLNRLVGRDAAIVSEIPGTTRDLIEAPVSLMGLPLIFVDTAGIRDSEDRIEQIGVARARQEMASADIVLNLDSGTFDQSSNAINLLSKSDLGRVDNDRVIISGKTGEGIDRLIARITGLARSLLPSENLAVLNGRHRQALQIAASALDDIADQNDEILIAEQLRIARRAIADVTGGNDAEDVLDVLFGSFCIGK